MFTIQDGRSKFYQWDKGRKLIVKDSTISEVHFSNGVVGCALVCETYTEDGKTFANVPNILLTSDLPVAVYAYSADYTKHSARFKVHSRPKPADYVYTETEIWTAEKAVAAALEEAKANGDFKGDKGDKGDAGAIKFIVVAELPAEGEDGAIYLLPSADGADQNAYDEFIFNAGEWEKIGSASVAVDLTDYVKNTDYASAAKAGVVKVAYGLRLINGALAGISVTPDVYKTVNSNEVIAKGTLENIKSVYVKEGITANTETLTDEEKTAACEWLGAIEKLSEGNQNEVPATKHNYATGRKSMVVDTYNTANKFAIPSRTSFGGIYLPDTAVSGDNPDFATMGGQIAVNKNYVDGLAVERKQGVVTFENDGTQNNIQWHYNAMGGTIARRMGNGTLWVATPDHDSAAANKAYVDAAIAALEARIAALEAKAGAV